MQREADNVTDAMAEAIYGSKTNTQIPDAIAATAISMGFPPQNIGQLIGAVLSHGSLAGIEGLTGPITGAVFAEVARVTAHGYLIVWMAFLPATIVAAVACAFLKNPKDRMNFIVDAPLDRKKDHFEAVEQHERQHSPSEEAKF